MQFLFRLYFSNKIGNIKVFHIFIALIIKQQKQQKIREICQEFENKRFKGFNDQSLQHYPCNLKRHGFKKEKSVQRKFHLFSFSHIFLHT